MVFIKLSVVLLIVVCIQCQITGASKQYDHYVLEAQMDCKSGKSYWSCIKYRLGRYLWSLDMDAFSFAYEPNNEIEFIPLNQTESSTELFPEARFVSDEQELSKGFKFIKRAISNFAVTNGIRFNLDDDSGVQLEEIEEEGRGKKFLKHKKKKKLKILFSVLAIIKLFHIKALLGLVLLSIGLVQLMLVGAGGALFFYLRRNTVCKIQPFLVSHSSHSPPESDISYSSEKWPTSFNKEWASARAYHGHA